MPWRQISRVPQASNRGGYARTQKNVDRYCMDWSLFRMGRRGYAIPGADSTTDPLLFLATPAD